MEICTIIFEFPNPTDIINRKVCEDRCLALSRKKYWKVLDKTFSNIAY